MVSAQVKEHLEDLAVLWAFQAPPAIVDLLEPAAAAGNELARAVYERYKNVGKKAGEKEGKRIARTCVEIKTVASTLRVGRGESLRAERFNFDRLPRE